MNSLHFNPPVIAHRGASGYAPENTLMSFRQAAQMGIKWVEFDVMLSADNVPIIFHDTKLKRTTNASGNVRNFDYAKLSTLDAGSWFNPKFADERIPTLAQVLQLLRDTQISANVEIKPLRGQDEKTVDYAVQEILKYFPDPNTSILFSSFSKKSLRYLRTVLPNCRMGVLIHNWWKRWEKTCDELNCMSVNVNEEILSPELVARIKKTGRALLSYTVNNPARATELFSWGVDAVFSDFPDKILKNN